MAQYFAIPFLIPLPVQRDESFFDGLEEEMR